MSPRRFAVVGDPVAHSKSPAMHAAAFAALGLPHVYEAVYATADQLPAVIALLRKGAYDGLNVTVPHKQRVLGLVDRIDASAERAGAANTLVRAEDGTITAHNTDAPALAAELRRVARGRPPWSERRALVIGSGGAARAAIVALATHLGVRNIAVRARAFDDARRRAEFIASAPAPIASEPWAPSAEGERQTLAVVQATSAGMAGAAPGDGVAAVVAWDALPADAVAIDVVYAPRDTPFLRAARGRGLGCDDGLGMLARQGSLAFELWLGMPAPFDAMRAAIE
jgi:shikimate dehydrogenase